ncbi:MaoC family dehydratase [Bordetella sp. 15P40C-2]|uniref:MaoC family dehydratase n=1 Tax=Bordetella sp. 15P40C-2 TaxID=2572246 RepID=UPI0013252068|nr:MaoC family dehydratase [Bordetella sp. 15P40C-2]MVW70992.1 acyl dehydratase [Bordetella sp. 15P40C-2]
MTSFPSHRLQPARLSVTADAIRTYAELTDDFNPLHLDSAFAAKTPMGRVIAHGTMSLCLLWQCLHKNFDATRLAQSHLDIRFLKPVFIGETLHASGELAPGTLEASESPAPRGWRVWVRGDDDQDRLAGVLHIPG